MSDQRHETTGNSTDFHETRMQYQEIPIPELLDDYIYRGIRQAQFRRKKIFRRVWSAVASIALITVFVTSVRVSTAFASLVSQIPGLNEIVKLIQYDRGLNSAVENDFMQAIGKSDEHDGIRITLDAIIMDEVRMNAFYTIETIDPQVVLIENFARIQISFENSAFPDIEHAISHSGSPTITPEGKDNAHFQTGVADVQFTENEAIYPEQAIFRAELPGYDTKWEIPFEIDVDKFKGLKEVLNVHETIEIEGQTITFTEATIYPTRIIVKVTADPANTKQILGYRDLKIINDKGEVLNWPLASGPTESGEAIFYFESNYFDKPTHLYLEGSTLSALDRDQLKLVIDPVKGEIITSPDDQVKITRVDHQASMSSFNLQITGIQPWDNTMYTIVEGEFQDESGTKFNIEPYRTSSSNTAEGSIDTEFSIPKAEYEGLLTFPITSYPSFIKKPFRVQIK